MSDEPQIIDIEAEIIGEVPLRRKKRKKIFYLLGGGFILFLIFITSTGDEEAAPQLEAPPPSVGRLPNINTNPIASSGAPINVDVNRTLEEFNERRVTEANEAGEATLVAPVPVRNIEIRSKPVRDKPVRQITQTIPKRDIIGERNSRVFERARNFLLDLDQDVGDIDLIEIEQTVGDAETSHFAGSGPINEGENAAILQENLRQNASSPDIQATDILAGINMIGLNSDIGGPVKIDLIGFKFGKASLIGSFSRVKNYLDIRLNGLIIEGRPMIPIKAVALDDASLSAGLRTNFSSRWCQRFCVPIVARFLQGFGLSLAQQTKTTTIGNGQTTVIEEGNLSTRNQAILGVATAAQMVGTQLEKDAAEVKPLVTLSQDQPVAVFFIEDVFLGDAK